MRKLLLALFLLPFFSGNIIAQLNIGYVDSDTIMKELPDAQDAQTKLDNIIKEWQDELARLEKDYKGQLDEFEKRKLIMSDELKTQKQRELDKIKQEVEKYRQDKFGVNGELFKKQDEVMKPVQNKIFTAIKEVAEDEDLDFVFDRSGDILFLYAKDEYDVTSKVLAKLK
ncbi:MAG: OmpH family outer membrane protein [Bacteroidetes bacterium]|nr:OmpH family outer membrane protein [Bacteroidota bacterium]